MFKISKVCQYMNHLCSCLNRPLVGVEIKSSNLSWNTDGRYHWWDVRWSWMMDEMWRLIEKFHPGWNCGWQAETTTLRTKFLSLSSCVEFYPIRGNTPRTKQQNGKGTKTKKGQPSVRHYQWQCQSSSDFWLKNCCYISKLPSPIVIYSPKV